MRIGEFANKYDVKKSTIRYYTDLQLLLPNKDEKYPDYDEQCIKDMDHIISLKDMGFSVDEIVMLVNYERINVKLVDYEKEAIKVVFHKKMYEVDDMIKVYQGKKDRLSDYLKSLHIDENDERLGCDFTLVNALACSVCASKLSVEDIQAEYQLVKEARLLCDGHEQWVMVDGIFTQDPLAKHNSSYRRAIDDLFTHMRDVDMSQYFTLNMLGESIKREIKDWHHERGLMFLVADTDLIHMRMDEIMVDEGVYIFINHDFHDLKELFEKLSKFKPKGRLLFIHTDSKLPNGIPYKYILDNASEYYDFASDKEQHYSWKSIDKEVDIDEILSIQFVQKGHDNQLFNEDLLDKFFDAFGVSLASKTNIAEGIKLTSSYRSEEADVFEVDLRQKLYMKKKRLD